MAIQKTSSATRESLSIARLSSKLSSIRLSSAALALIFLLTLLAATPPAQAQTETVLHNFNCRTDGCSTTAGLVIDGAGNLYGTTPTGGPYAGTVFELTSSGTFTVLYGFGVQAGDGYAPFGGVILDSAGNLYGTTEQGGAYNAGTVFELTPTGTETILYSFGHGRDGFYPITGVVLDQAGNLYGTTQIGGTHSYGTVFMLTPSSGTFTTLYNFTGGADGNEPYGVAVDQQGNLYGITLYGGTYGFGVVFKVTPSGTETVLHNFTPNGVDGLFPSAPLTVGPNGNLYGTTSYGGALGVGTVFEITPSGTETILHSFAAGKKGFYPVAGVTFDKKGNLYGTTFYGGSSDLGTVFKLTPLGAESVLHSFADNGTDGFGPDGAVAIDKAGNIYSTTYDGGSGLNCGYVYGCGTIFKINPKKTLSHYAD